MQRRWSWYCAFDCKTSQSGREQNDEILVNKRAVRHANQREKEEILCVSHIYLVRGEKS